MQSGLRVSGATDQHPQNKDLEEAVVSDAPSTATALAERGKQLDTRMDLDGRDPKDLRVAIGVLGDFVTHAPR